MTSNLTAFFLIVSLWFSLALFCRKGPSISKDAPHTIKYVVNGTAQSVTVTYQSPLGNSEQRTGVKIPWSATYDVRDGAFLIVSAYNETSEGTVSTAIEIDGKQYELKTQEGSLPVTSQMNCCPK